MSFKLDMSRFKKVSSDKNHTVMEHDDGHQIKIAHNALSRSAKMALSKLHMAEGGAVNQIPRPQKDDNNSKKTINELIGNPFGDRKPKKYASGGDVSEQEPLPVDLQPEQAPDEQQPKAAFKAPESIPVNMNPSPENPLAAAQSPVPAKPELNQQSQPALPPQVAPQRPNQPDTLGGYQKQVESQNQQAAAQAQAAASQAQALATNLQAQATLQDNFQSKLQDNLDERAQLQDDIKNQHIDPNHYLGSQTSGQKFATAIGLILGGIGGALTGQRNVAMDFLNKSIDEDINAQKANLGKKESLLSANLKEYSNMRDAQDMTRLMMNDTLKTKLQLAEAKAADPLAKARAQQAIGQLEQQTAPLAQQMATRQMLQNMSSQPGQLSQMDPAKLIPSVIPEKEQASAFKELQEAQNMSTAKENILGAFNKLSEINTIGNRISSPVQTARQVAAIKDPLVAGLSKSTAGRFTEQDAGMLDSLFPKPGDSPDTTSEKKNRIDKLISEKMHFPVLNAYGLDPEKFQSTTGDQSSKLSPEHQQFAQRAKQDLNSPDPAARTKATLVLRKLGLQ